ncbi:hypothetical protein RRG08_050504 [Elysia crispata]|uniref:Uncharacterized protein n=1 Tax=Elysia crispata TaxID=231223 RepID=A0AAE0XTL1_9GAST|nr:hypothetical protein RRG08_050504 [Elysia crispata]
MASLVEPQLLPMSGGKAGLSRAGRLVGPGVEKYCKSKAYCQTEQTEKVMPVLTSGCTKFAAFKKSTSRKER